MFKLNHLLLATFACLALISLLASPTSGQQQNRFNSLRRPTRLVYRLQPVRSLYVTQRPNLVVRLNKPQLVRYQPNSLYRWQPVRRPQRPLRMRPFSRLPMRPASASNSSNLSPALNSSSANSTLPSLTNRTMESNQPGAMSSNQTLSAPLAAANSSLASAPADVATSSPVGPLSLASPALDSTSPTTESPSTPPAAPVELPAYTLEPNRLPSVSVDNQEKPESVPAMPSN